MVLARNPARATAKRLAFLAGNKVLREISEPSLLEKPYLNLIFETGQLPDPEVTSIEFQTDSDQPLHYGISIKGVQKQQNLKQTGKEIRIQRRVERLRGKGGSAKLTEGDYIAVHLDLDLDQAQRYLALEEPRPAGCEYAGEQIHGDALGQITHTEFRDDRLAVFFSSLPAGKHTLTYYLRAETPGRSQILPGRLYPMYNEEKHGETGTVVLEIRSRRK
jgi:uncharacterized protein YfaS (alpha-2-macroglobulin family)